jgi:hypothetical protein
MRANASRLESAAHSRKLDSRFESYACVRRDLGGRGQLPRRSAGLFSARFGGPMSDRSICYPAEPEEDRQPRPEFVSEDDWASCMVVINSAILHCQQSPAERAEKTSRTSAECIADIIALWGAVKDQLIELAAHVDAAKLDLESRRKLQ